MEKPLESRKKRSETWLSDQAEAVGTGYPDLYLGVGALVSTAKWQRR